MLQAGQIQLAMEYVETFFSQLTGNPYSDAKKDIWEKKYATLQESAVARLAIHRFNLRNADISPSTLSELMLRYEAFNCQEASDHVYALFNLIGKHRASLEVNYSQTAFERYQTILLFIQKHENVPTTEMMRIANLLREQLFLRSEPVTQKQVKHEIGIKETTITTTAMILGSAEPYPGAAAVLQLRKTSTLR